MAKLKETLVSGKKIDVLKIEPAVTPNIILGYNDEQRFESNQDILLISVIEFNAAISELNDRFEEHKEKAKRIVEASKQVTKADQKENLK